MLRLIGFGSGGLGLGMGSRDPDRDPVDGMVGGWGKSWMLGI